MKNCQIELNRYLQQHALAHIDFKDEITKYLKPCIAEGLEHKDYMAIIALISSNLQLIHNICEATLTGQKQVEECVIGTNPPLDNMKNFMMVSDIHSATRLLKNHLKHYLVENLK